MDPGTLAMANADDPSVGRTGTNGSQFFVMEGARPDLVGHHTIFGKCKEVDVVKKVTHTPTTEDKPNTPVTINKVTISR
jgi:peptidyl-prolyl cis-trans isomerase A (cyclophilin A)